MDRALPSRNALFSCRRAWMKEMGEAQRERFGHSAHEWVVHGKVYDLAPYLASHPGGRHWLELTQGMDVTPLFESHHVDDAKTRAVLGQFYVRDCPNTPPPASALRQPLLSPEASVAPQSNKGADGSSPVEADFSFLDSGFYRSFKRRALGALRTAEENSKNKSKRGARGPTMEMRALTWALLLAWLSALVWCCSARSGSVPAVVAGILLNALAGIGHNGMHTAPTWWRWLLDLSLFSSHEWTISHCLSHHHYPGTQADFEVAAIEPFIYSLYAGPANNAYLPFYFWSVLCILGPFELLARLINIVLRRIQPWRPEHLLPGAELVLLMLFGRSGAWAGWWRWLTMHVVASVLLGLQALPLHHSEHAWRDGKAPSPRPVDFGLHALRATQDYAISHLPLLAKLVLFPYNHHRLHHLLPAVDESRLPLLEGALLETCQEFGENYVVYAWRDLARGTLRNWFDVGGRKRRAWALAGEGLKRE
ncbi:cytochrome b5-related protein [Nannochloropsis gaditana]|uniref:Cytochrome b5-related protein n=2 Tax=Nannochloropsis gaditana TaxID=72520 RepID=W7U3H1_9STRA|nr:cytochrome b5-related protein [Nannochloropsis gaditana]